MKIKYWLLTALIGLSGANAYAVWDKTLPLGSESKSLGDDRIREFKTDVETSLQYEGDFPGTDTSNPRFIYTPSTGTTALRPTGNDAPAGRLYINVSSNTIEMSRGSGVWDALNVVGSSMVTSSGLAVDVAGAGLAGGGGVPLRVNVDSTTFSILNDTITVNTGAITSAHILDGTIQGVDFATGTVLPGFLRVTNQPRFFAYNSATDTNVTGDGTTITIDADTEVFDTASNFVASTFTAPVTGFYHFDAMVGIKDLASGNKCELRLVTTARTYTNETWPTSNAVMQISVLADMSAGNTAWLQLSCSGGGKALDILGNNGTTLGIGYPTYFSGYLE